MLRKDCVLLPGHTCSCHRKRSTSYKSRGPGRLREEIATRTFENALIHRQSRQILVALRAVRTLLDASPDRQCCSDSPEVVYILVDQTPSQVRGLSCPFVLLLDQLGPSPRANPRLFLVVFSLILDSRQKFRLRPPLRSLFVLHE